MNRPLAVVPGNLKCTELRVLAWTDHFFGDDYLEPVTVPNPGGPDIRMTFTRDRQELHSADAVWFHGPSIRDMPPRSRKRQPWILMSMESAANYPALKDPASRLIFDLLMTYRLDSDVPCIYPNQHQYGDFRQPGPQHRGPASGALATYIASNPVVYRDDFASRLMEHIPVDSLGTCLQNRQIDDFVVGGWSQGAWQSIVRILTRYKFYLAFENSQATDYVTERVFHALRSGSVPVYLGASNVRDFMPADDALIVASEFNSPRALAEYLKMLDGDDPAYAKHLAWKSEAYSSSFSRMLELGDIDPQHRLAIKLAHGCDSRCHCGGRVREPGVLP